MSGHGNSGYVKESMVDHRNAFVPPASRPSQTSDVVAMGGQMGNMSIGNTMFGHPAASSVTSHPSGTFLTSGDYPSYNLQPPSRTGLAGPPSQSGYGITTGPPTVKHNILPIPPPPTGSTTVPTCNASGTLPTSLRMMERPTAVQTRPPPPSGSSINTSYSFGVPPANTSVDPRFPPRSMVGAPPSDARLPSSSNLQSNSRLYAMDMGSNIAEQPPPTISTSVSHLVTSDVIPPPVTGVPPTSTIVPPPPVGSSFRPRLMSDNVPPISANLPTMGINVPPPLTDTRMPPPPTGTRMPPPPTGARMPPPPTGARMPPPLTGARMPPPPMGTSMPPPPMGTSMPPPPMGTSMPPPPMGTSMPPPPMGTSMPPPSSGSNVLRSTYSNPDGLTAPLSQHYSRSISTGPEAISGVPPSGQQPSYPSHLGGPSMQKQMQLPELQPVNLMENRNILPAKPIEHPSPSLPGHLSDFVPDPGVFCSSMNTIPATSALLNKLKLPLAIHIHPFKDSKAKSCPVINPSVIVRCRVCRAYINPYVSFSDARHWRCNLCYRTNVVPEDYDYNPHSGKRGDRTHHAELKHSSVEYIAPSEYMVRPPQPSVYLFLIDVSYPTVESGLLAVFCRTLLECLTRLPGDGRTMVGFLTYDQHLHFYNLKSSQTQPQMLVVSDINDVFIPSPNSLLVNLRESKELVKNLLEDLPKMFSEQRAVDSALGAALQVAEKLLHPIGGRITVLQSSLPNVGPGSLQIKEQSQSSLKKDQLSMGVNSDFYKKLALECSAQQIAVDLFVFSSPRRFIDLPTLSTIAKFSSGQISYYADFHHTKEAITRTVEKDLRRYLTRNIGFEAVMRVRCTEGMSLHTFHGNFFVRSTDLLSLPNVNPDHGFCMNLAIDENLKEYTTVCFQAALLYTTYRGERRIRVHTLCLPVSEQIPQIYAGINVRAAAAVLAKMAVDRMTTATLGDAREALLNTVQDATKAYRSSLGSSLQSSQFTLPSSLKLLPLYVLSLLKHPSLTLNPNVMIDERAQAVNLILTLPLNYLLANIYPALYALHTLSEKDVIDCDGEEVVSPPVLQLSAEKLSRHGVYLMDYGKGMFIWVSKDTSPETIKQILGVVHFGAIEEFTTELPVQEFSLSKYANHLIRRIKMSRQHYMPLLVIREDGSQRKSFINRLLEDKTEDGTSYYELLSHIARQINK